MRQPPSELAARLESVRARIAAAAEKARRDPREVTLVAVTKYAGGEQIRELLSLGVADLGENRVQQLLQRAAQINEYHQRRLAARQESVPAKIRWHMIGHLQRNKVRQALPVVSMIHGVDSLRLAETLEAECDRTGRPMQVMLQVNASEEPQKHGVAVGAAVHLAEMIAGMKHLQFTGLMTMAKYGATESEARFVFGRTREIFEELRYHKIGGPHLRHLSMGMSDDFEWAIQEGATIVRIGSAIFGKPAVTEDDDDEPNQD